MADPNDHHKTGRNLVKINDLPLYPENKSKSSAQSSESASNDLEKSLRHARRTVAENLSFVGDAFQVSRGYYEHGVGKSKELYEKLTDEKEQTAKIVAIATGGLLGLAMSARKGLFKKVLYTSVFAGSVGAFCYPKVAKEYVDVACYITKNKIPPVVKDYTGIDLNEQAKKFNDSLPDLSSIKKLWTDQKETAKSPPPPPSQPSEGSEKKK